MPATKKPKAKSTPASKQKSKSKSKSDESSPKARVVGGSVVRGAAKKPSGDAKKAKKVKKKDKSAKKKAPKKNKRPRYTARTADKYELYEKAVQSPDTDVEFLARVYKRTRKRTAYNFREDFCGTGLLSSHWIRQSPKHFAEGFDIDPEPVAWGLERNFEPLGEDAARYTVHLKDVRAKGFLKPDIRVAQNFSYCVFHERSEMLEYFRAVYDSLADDGIFVMDLHGGPEATEEMEEERKCGGFTYVWDQDQFWPGTGEYRCYIKFRFPDGTEKKAFTYVWRMWYLTELRDILRDAGFERVDSYFEGTDENGEDGNGVFSKGVKGENCLSWIAYLAAIK